MPSKFPTSEGYTTSRTLAPSPENKGFSSIRTLLVSFSRQTFQARRLFLEASAYHLFVFLLVTEPIHGRTFSQSLLSAELNSAFLHYSYIDCSMRLIPSLVVLPCLTPCTYINNMFLVFLLFSCYLHILYGTNLAYTGTFARLNWLVLQVVEPTSDRLSYWFWDPL